MQDKAGAVLDVGTGTGDIARPFASYVKQVDAVDISEAMIKLGKSLPGGDASNLRWLHGRAENANLQPPYALITAGESLHWMDWAVVLPRFAKMLMPGGYLAMIGRSEISMPWRAELFKLINEYSTNKDFQPYNLIEELEKRQLFRLVGAKQTEPVAFTQTVDQYIESMHSRNGFSRDRMTAAAAHEFDAKFKALLEPYCPDRLVHLQIVGSVNWGVPLSNT
jgi:ubiquinone/menaquinone biosynthesis C-methylase UbiE